MLQNNTKHDFVKKGQAYCGTAGIILMGSAFIGKKMGFIEVDEAKKLGKAGLTCFSASVAPSVYSKLSDGEFLNNCANAFFNLTNDFLSKSNVK